MNVFRPLACAALLALCPAGFAQQPTATKAEPAKAPEPDLAILRAMKSKLFVLQHREFLQLQSSLSALGSGVAGATIRFGNQNGLNTVGVRDFPENIAAIEEAIKRLDTPGAPQATPDVELHIHVLLASKHPTATVALPDELVEVMRNLKDTLSYKGYALAASFVQRAQMAGRQTEGTGLLDAQYLGGEATKVASLYQVEWSFNSGPMDVPKEGPAQIRLRDFGIHLREKNGGSDSTLARLRTDLAFKEGEKVVVGTSTLKDRGFIVVLTGHRVN